MFLIYSYGSSSSEVIVEEEFNDKTASMLDSLTTNIYSEISVNFNQNNGVYQYTEFIKDFGNVYQYSDSEKLRHTIVNSTLVVTLLKDEIGQAGGAICDISIEKGIGYSMEYKVKFQEGFEWTKGGKLPGIGGGKVYAGGSDVSAGDGWFSRPVQHYYDGTFRWVTQNSGREINELMWDIFRGGTGSDYMATADNLIYFDTFVIDQQ